MASDGAKKIVLLLGSLLLGLLACEGTLRVGLGRTPRFDLLKLSPVPGLLYEHKRNIQVEADIVVRDGEHGLASAKTFYGINTMGFRDRKYGPEDLQGKKIVLCLGDSTTFGTGVRFEDTYPKALERLLPSRFVINAGVWGYDAWQYKAALEHLAPTIRPDTVVVGLFMNDHVRNSPHAGRLKFLLEERFVLAGEVRNLIDVLTSRLRRIDAARFQEEIKRMTTSASTGALLAQIEAYGGERRLLLEEMQRIRDLDRWKTALENLTSMKAYCDAREIRLVVAIFPVRPQVMFGYDDPEPQNTMTRFLTGKGIPLTDMTPVFRKEIADGRILYNSANDGAHFNADGHHLVALQISPLIR